MKSLMNSDESRFVTCDANAILFLYFIYFSQTFWLFILITNQNAQQ